MDRATKYPIIQSNGQRIYHPSPSSPTPPRGSEIFVGNLPRDLYEDELIPIFSEVGPIYKFRLMMNFCGDTRGFAFVCYQSTEDAKKAICMLEGTLIRSKKSSSLISVKISLDNCRLYFGNIPRAKTPEEIRNDLREIMEGIVDVFVYKDQKDPKLNRGFAFVEFESHACAAITRRKLLAGVRTLWDDRCEKMFVEWADPEPVVDSLVLTQVTVLYFRNLPITWSRDRFKKFIRSLLASIPVSKTYKRGGYAFVHFFNRSDAEKALSIFQTALQFLSSDDKLMEVEWARPAEFSKKNREDRLPDHKCMSVPPKTRKLLHSMQKKQAGELTSSDSASGSTSTLSDVSPEMDLVSEELLAVGFNRMALESGF